MSEFGWIVLLVAGAVLAVIALVGIICDREHQDEQNDQPPTLD